jgi:hypothetical protein
VAEKVEPNSIPEPATLEQVVDKGLANAECGTGNAEFRAFSFSPLADRLFVLPVTDRLFN